MQRNSDILKTIIMGSDRRSESDPINFKPCYDQIDVYNKPSVVVS